MFSCLQELSVEIEIKTKQEQNQNRWGLQEGTWPLRWGTVSGYLLYKVIYGEIQHALHMPRPALMYQSCRRTAWQVSYVSSDLAIQDD